MLAPRATKMLRFNNKAAGALALLACTMVVAADPSLAIEDGVVGRHLSQTSCATLTSSMVPATSTYGFNCLAKGKSSPEAPSFVL